MKISRIISLVLIILGVAVMIANVIWGPFNEWIIRISGAIMFAALLVYYGQGNPKRKS